MYRSSAVRGTGANESMSDIESPAAAVEEKPVNDGQEAEFEDEVAAAESDRESDKLSEIDEDQFEDYNPETANIEDRPVDIDEDVVRTLKAAKRKRTDGDVPRKPREGRREKNRRDRIDDPPPVEGHDEEGDQASQRRARRAGGIGVRGSRAKAGSPEADKEEELTPEERRKRAIDRALDSAMKKSGPTKRRRRDEIVSLEGRGGRGGLRL